MKLSCKPVLTLMYVSFKDAESFNFRIHFDTINFLLYLLLKIFLFHCLLPFPRHTFIPSRSPRIHEVATSTDGHFPQRYAQPSPTHTTQE